MLQLIYMTKIYGNDLLEKRFFVAPCHFLGEYSRMNFFGSQKVFNVMLHSPHFSGDTRDSKLSLNNFSGANAPTYLYDKYMTLTCLKKKIFFVALFHIPGKCS
jgi:hypothetical protein